MLYIDVDAMSKLAHWNALPLLPKITGFAWEEVVTVSSLRFRAQRCREKADGKVFHHADAAIRIIEHLELMGVAGTPDPAILSELSSLPQIDEGEAVLLSLTLGDAQGVFLTGDKRALRGLAQNEICRRFARRILVLEQILEQCLAQAGHKWVLANFCPYKHIDKAINAILGSRCDTGVENLMDGIHSYLGELDRLHDPSMLYSFDDAVR
ncbi:MAG TPA: hypothetical protein VJ698_20730 [Noviherbaspirillum sp.]|uniref:hypothetical protein n=1 Tax=Noviherbaspirillum sp. TaxID=1926288 RepID=UPI002B47936F|nr:hypothetical protein [Noviherbaspirillum sp.]HJV87908.1 hypothetical protein [Noviherbaspirillum sp.]